MPIFFKMLQKVDEDSTLPNSFCETIITLMPKLQKKTTGKKKLQKSKLQDNIFDEYRCQNSPQNISKPNKTLCRKDHTE